MIEVEDLTKDFGATRAVNHASFKVEAGEIIGLLGPNGSGKTTLMRVLTGFFPPTSGHARIGGLDVEEHSLEVRRQIGYLPENVVLYPDMRVERFLSFCGEVKGLGRQKLRERVERVIQDVGLAEVRRKEIGKLSKGYRQRVGIAQALVHEPRVLVLDEPTVGLDPNQVVEIREVIRALRGQATILLSTHILPEVSVVCDRVIIIDRGRVIAIDTTEGLHRKVHGMSQTLVRVEGPGDGVAVALRAIIGVDRVDERPVPTDSSTRLVVTSSRGEDVRKEIVQVIAAGRWSLLEVSPIALTLEELFVRLVREDRAQVSGASPGGAGAAGH
ncbi:MAG: gliding motility-associated transport system ATP-binding protein [Candidatus Binatota bacterium]|nr:gliding motility-associated transport system ATP-binding protein [Candidatus Binatota bacterium]